MARGHDLVLRLMDPSLPAKLRGAALHEFAIITGWRPSFEVDYPATGKIAGGHLLVEHGLQPTVAITFLLAPYPFKQLDLADQFRLLSISYNNLVDWHCFPSQEGLWIVYNRTRPFTARYVSIDEQPDAWRVEAFDKIIGRGPSPNLPALDDALIKTVSGWKRILASELGSANITGLISELFNAIFFVRALEDDRRKVKPNPDRALLLELDDNPRNKKTLRSVIQSTLGRLLNETGTELPKGLWDETILGEFDKLDPETVRELLLNFYENKFAPYAYDFSLMSKHALSRIYEHYISFLKEKDEVGQKTFFPEPMEEVPNRMIGGVYTPLYIARFFSRYLEVNHTPPRFRQLKVAEPALGSGLFLRTLLEMQCDPVQSIDVKATAAEAFGNILGVDYEANACRAARLSLSLLHLVLTGKFPEKMRIECQETISFVLSHPELLGKFDAVIANPPYVKWENIPEDWQPSIAAYLAAYDTPKPDLYLAFVKIGLDLLAPNGFMLYVLPHAFLLADGARKIRAEISKTCWVRLLADLSEVGVFEDTSSYPILLVLQKKPEYPALAPEATIVRCTAFAGHSLEDALEGRMARNSYYTIYATGQPAFAANNWRVLGPQEERLQQKILRFVKLSEFAFVKQGFITGKDPIFIRPRVEVPSSEMCAYIPYLSDREMEKYRVPPRTSRVVFYPYLGETLMEEKDVRENFPQTWAYLESHAVTLKERKSLYRIGEERWWRPLWPRPPQDLLRPKIVTPHLILVPRFSLDSSGKYGVTHTPFIFPKDKSNDDYLLRYFLAILNSSIGRWQLATQSHRYERGYLRLEASTLQNFTVPSPAAVPPRVMDLIQKLVGKLIDNPVDRRSENDLDALVLELYGIERNELEDIVLPSE